MSCHHVTGVLEQLAGLGARPQKSHAGPQAGRRQLLDLRRGSQGEDPSCGARGVHTYLTRRYLHTATPYGIYYISPLAAIAHSLVR